MAEKVPTSWEKLYAEHYQPVFKHLCRLGAKHDVEDIMQETFVTAYLQLPTFKGESSLRTWIMGIAYNRLRNHRRSPSKRYEVEDLVEALSDKSASPEEVSAQRETIRRLYQLLEKLPEEISDTFVMARYNGYSYEELASIFGIAVNTVGSRVNRVQEALRSAYATMEGKR